MAEYTVGCATWRRFGTTRFGPLDSVIADTGWTKERLMDEANPLGGGTIVTLFGFKSRKRTWEGLLTQATRDRLQSQYDNSVVATLVDEDNQQTQALILSYAYHREFMLGTVKLYRYRVEWIDRS